MWVANWLGLVWHGWKCPKYFKLENEKQYIQQTGHCQVSFVRWISVDQGSYEISVICPSITPSTGQFNIFRRSSWLAFSDFFSLSYIILTSKDWWSLILAGYLCLLIFWQKIPQIRVAVAFLKVQSGEIIVILERYIVLL